MYLYILCITYCILPETTKTIEEQTFESISFNDIYTCSIEYCCQFSISFQFNFEIADHIVHQNKKIKKNLSYSDFTVVQKQAVKTAFETEYFQVENRIEISCRCILLTSQIIVTYFINNWFWCLSSQLFCSVGT